MIDRTFSFRTLCFMLVEAIESQSTTIGLSDDLLDLASEVKVILEERYSSTNYLPPSNNELQELWMSDVTMKEAEGYPTRAVWFARTVLDKWGKMGS